jgi:hypothetical protein
MYREAGLHDLNDSIDDSVVEMVFLDQVAQDQTLCQ